MLFLPSSLALPLFIANLLSIVKCLEDAVADMEIKLGGSELGNDRTLFTPFNSGPSPITETPDQEKGPIGYATNVGRILASSWRPEAIACHKGLAHGSMLLAESDLPAPLYSHHSAIPDNVIECCGVGFSSSQESMPELIPPEISRTLLNIYLEKILPHDPFLLEDDLLQLYHETYDQDTIATRKDPAATFILCIVFAIVVSMY